MRLLQSVLPTLRQTKKPQQKFVAHLLRLLLMFPGHATFRNLSRYSAYHERTLARWYARDFDFVSLNKAAISQVIPPAHEQALVIDASFIPKSGKKTYGLDHFWNSSHSRNEKGLEISTLAWLDITDNCAYCLGVEQTPPTDKTTGSETTRIDGYLDQLARVVSEHHLRHLRYVVTDGYYSKQKFTRGVRALGLEQIGKLRIDANLRYLYQGPKRPGPGRPKTYDGKVNWDDLSRFENVETEDDDIVLYHQVLNHVQFQWNLRVVLVVDTKHNRRAVLFSTDVDLDALILYRYYKARFQIEFLFRDAKQFTGLTDSQARSQVKLHFHFNASLSAVTLAKLEARQHTGDAASVFSMASLKRRAFNQHLIERISQYLATGHSLEKSSPDYEELCNYGTITDLAA
jgi:DDE superfamily endonuclease